MKRLLTIPALLFLLVLLVLGPMSTSASAQGEMGALLDTYGEEGYGGDLPLWAHLLFGGWLTYLLIKGIYIAFFGNPGKERTEVRLLFLSLSPIVIFPIIGLQFSRMGALWGFGIGVLAFFYLSSKFEEPPR